MKTDDKKIYLVDSGLSFNLPFPIALRPQRGIELYITFDFSSRKTDVTPPFRVSTITHHFGESYNQELYLNDFVLILFLRHFPFYRYF